jgi:fatty-acyl-CoA synthase
VLEPGKSVSEDALLELCRTHLARFKVPRHVLFAEASELPTTPTGKVQKFKLVEIAVERLSGG